MPQRDARGLRVSHGTRGQDGTAEEAEKWFRSNWPLRFGARKQDVDRHTGGTAYANACQNLPATAMYMGNGIDDLVHYLGLFPQPELQPFYQTIATPLLAIVRPEAIPLPSWFDGQLADAHRAEQAAVGDLVTTLIAHSNDLVGTPSEAADGDVEQLPAPQESPVPDTVAA